MWRRRHIRKSSNWYMVPNRWSDSRWEGKGVMRMVSIISSRLWLHYYIAFQSSPPATVEIVQAFNVLIHLLQLQVFCFNAGLSLISIPINSIRSLDEKAGNDITKKRARRSWRISWKISSLSTFVFCWQERVVSGIFQ